MATKTILSGVPVGDKVYNAGMEDELAKVLDAAQIKHLTEQGAIEGYGSAKAPETETGSANETLAKKGK